ncbi:nucleolar protein 6 [Phtheirospermum japonicum]|uniref:Nucleolar protein 6 n=1 Tax=Phtheirospermum japonicum TaxID=374723 RepID=A0A830D6E9_9LAMI|nr:nucleolar protein 6 [Phtheirospermum japonicum]
MASRIETHPDSTDLKLRELLKEVQLDYSAANTAIINDVVSSIREAIHNIPDGLQVTADVAPGFVRDVGADKVDFKFRKPKSLEIGGSYSFQCVARPDVNVDLLLRLPKECFHEKDYLNYRYHAKRFLYLCTIKNQLKHSSLVHDVKWSTFHNEARKPVLVIYPAARLSDNTVFSLKIIPTAPSLFTLSKLNFERNNIRSLSQEATPKYNSSILEDMFTEDNAELIKRTFIDCKELREALLLLKVWARKSSLFVHDCLSGFLITVIVAYLASKSANSKVWDSGLFFQSEGERNISNKEKKTQLQSFPIIICDSFGDYNMAFRMSTSGFQELRDEAALALTCMDKCKGGGFDEIFMTTIDHPAKYDYCIRMNLKDNHDFHVSGFCLDDESWRSYEQKVFGIIDQALKGRTKLIRVIWRNTSSECNFENGLSTLDGEAMFVGITIGSMEEAFKQAIVGPSPEDKDKAVEFRKFWGEKATLRWFRDGKIAEVAVWEHEEWEKHLIIKEIAEHVLMRHLSLPKQNIIPIVDQLDFVLRHGNSDPLSFSKNLLKAYDDLSKLLRLLDDIPLRISSVQPLDSVTVYRYKSRLVAKGLNQIFGIDCKDSFSPVAKLVTVRFFVAYATLKQWPLPLCQMDVNNAFLHGYLHEEVCMTPPDGYSKALPGQLADVHQAFGWRSCSVVIVQGGTHFLLFQSSLRRGGCYTFRLISVFPPAPHPLAHEEGCRVKLEKTTATCIQPLEVMIQLEGSGNWPLDELAMEKTKSAFLLKIAESLQTKRGITCTATEDNVDVFMSGYAFRLKILHERGLSLVKRQDGAQSKRVLSSDKKLFLRGQHSSMINGLRGRYPTYGPVVRFLRLLSEYDWSFFPLIVDINADLTPDDDKEINEIFMSTRKDYEENPQNVKPAMFLATNYDKESEAWTSQSPNAADLRRLAAYATSSANFLTNTIMKNQIESYGWECLFRTPLNNYNAVILLHRDKLPYPHRLLFPSEVKLGRTVIRGNASKTFQPFLLPGELKGRPEELKSKLMREFPDTFKVWYDSFGGDAIGLTCGNKISKKRGRGDDDIVEDIDLLDALKAVGELGKGFVRSVHFLKAPKLSS